MRVAEEKKPNNQPKETVSPHGVGDGWRSNRGSQSYRGGATKRLYNRTGRNDRKNEEEPAEEKEAKGSESTEAT